MSAAGLDPAVLIHVDIDSPSTLLKFWGRSADFDDGSLGRFYEVAMGRALAVFKECGVPATFFCVGSELERSKQAAELVRQAFSSGHEIANHSFSHPYGFSELTLEQMKSEIQGCSKAIETITGKRPLGFRSPSFSMNARLLNLLESLSFEYDSSVFYSSLGPLMKGVHRFFRRGGAQSGDEGGLRPAPKGPYFPDPSDPLKEGPLRKLLEIPLPRSSFFGLPFYHNFHLMAGVAYRKLDLTLSRACNYPYLFHLIEFCDLSDGIPAELKVHPNLRKAAKAKLQSVKNTLLLFKKRYRIIRTDEFAEDFKRFKAEV